MERRQVPIYDRPAFCNACAKPFPWTQMALEAANDYATEIKLDIERKEFADIIENLVRDTSRTSLSASRLKALLDKAGPYAAEGFKKILGDVMAEGVKKLIWP